LPKTTSLLLIAVVVVGGCRREGPQQASPLDRGPANGEFAAPAGYGARALKAAGGLDAWKRARKLEFDGVVTIYEPDGSFYLTEHHYEIYPWSNSIRISAREPLGSFVWQLSDGRYEVLEGDTTADVSPLHGFYRDYAEAILAVVTAPVRLCDESLLFVQEPTAVKMQGLWYYPIERICPDEQLAVPRTDREYGWPRVVFYQNRDSSSVELIWFAAADEGKFLAVRGYDYDERRGKAVLLPARMEIFTTDARVAPKQQVAKVDVK
jgi:hypothetical protein